jgi:hypothetical protein
VRQELKRIITVSLLIGLGHILSVLLVPISNRYLSKDIVANIIVIDSSLMLVISILSFGLALTATRDIATSDSWKSKLLKVRDARFTLSVLLFFIGLFAFYFTDDLPAKWLPFIISPIIALNLDFALYGKGEPIKAAISSFIRLSLPLITFLLMSMFSLVTSEIYYLVCISLGVFLAGFYVTRQLTTQYCGTFNFQNLKVYKGVLIIGFVGLLLTFQRLGFVSVFSGYIAESEKVALYGVLKIYFAFIAVRRLFIQTFYTKLINQNVASKINTILFLIGLSVFFICLIFSHDISNVLFKHSDSFSTYAIRMIGLIILSGSVFSCEDARLMLFKGDKQYVRATFFGSFVFIVISSASLWLGNVFELVLWALFLAELSLSLGYKASVINIQKAQKNIIKKDIS